MALSKLSFSSFSSLSLFILNYTIAPIIANTRVPTM